METAATHRAPVSRSGPGLFFTLFMTLAILLGWPLVQSVVEPALYTFKLMRMPAPVVLAMPVRGVRVAALRDTWDGARSNGRRHEGIDIFARPDTPVLSATEGIVARVGTNTLGGKVVWVMGPGGQRHYYAHLNDYADIRTGQRVVPGTVLGYVGNTGNARGTPHHLHYGVYTGKGAINPYPLLVGK